MGDRATPSPRLRPADSSNNRSNRSNSFTRSTTFQEPVTSTAAHTAVQRPIPLSPQLQQPPSSTARSRTVGKQPQPIKDAISTAFDQAPSTNQMDKEFVKKLTEQVTEQVIKNLTAANIGGPGASPAVLPLHTQYGASTSSNASVARTPSYPSPLLSSIESFSAVPNSPSARLHRDVRDRHFSPSPDRPLSDAGSEHSSESKESAESRRSQQSTQSNRETTPRASQPDVLAGLRRTKTMQEGMPEEMRKTKTTRRRGSTSEAAAFRKDSKDSDSGYFDGYSKARVRPPSVAEEEDEGPTTLEKIWQPLFDNGNPTVRLGQLLRGLAKHLIEDCEPKGSLVIPPHKMLRFLSDTKVAHEHYPWSIIFGGKMSWNSISMMYRKLLCQHHLIQQQVHEAPLIPALTPLGFELFMTCMIQAHPDTEFERLSKAVKDMPISNADDCKERFPKELSRRLLPLSPNMQAEQRLISSLNHEATLILLERGTSAMPPPPPPQTPAPPDQPAFRERERNPYSQVTPRSNGFDDDDLKPPSIPIERERKPYYAKEGFGKRYGPEGDYIRERDVERDCNQNSREPSRLATSKYRPESSITRPRQSSRQSSGLSSQAMYGTSASTDPMVIPAQNGRGRGPALQAHNGSHGKRRSPPPRGFARSEPVDLSSIPSSQYASNLHGPIGPIRDRYVGDPDEDTLRYNSRRPNERNTNYTNDDDSSGRPVPPRSGPPGPSGYDSGYGSAGGVNNPLYHFVMRSSTGDDRRRSWYPGMAPMPATGSGVPNGGTDGYGSYMGSGQQAYGPSGQY
ncbi:hypothetical protein DOTSEDRAFT_67844 [Dothistroma septosporum NZE10]|uniref:DUF7514 domain-containing protein n=1 Tax=Dothistroma septosporum (strain NZE10 / CBS 128990) TaxID=675120 RepID=N1Q0W9_DOTSN|nr:hypothetical protein DOTSEDRAFT_67844 [Dothistroma septosporum NZE10]